MEESTSGCPKPNELVIADDKIYAWNDIKIGQVIEFLMTKLEPVHLEDLAPGDQVCPICLMKFCVSEDVKLSHPPVKTVCGHIFGKLCIIKWLSPLGYWGLTEGIEPLISELHPGSGEDVNTSCPTCRKVFFPELAVREPMDLFATCLWLWDTAYAFAGIARSEREEHSRKYLWEFVDYCRSINEFEFSHGLKLQFLHFAQLRIIYFAEWLETQALTPVQEDLRKRLEEFRGYNLSSMVRVIGCKGYFIYAQSEEDDPT